MWALDLDLDRSITCAMQVSICFPANQSLETSNAPNRVDGGWGEALGAKLDWTFLDHFAKS